MGLMTTSMFQFVSELNFRELLIDLCGIPGLPG